MNVIIEIRRGYLQLLLIFVEFINWPCLCVSIGWLVGCMCSFKKLLNIGKNYYTPSDN